MAKMGGKLSKANGKVDKHSENGVNACHFLMDFDGGFVKKARRDLALCFKSMF